MPLHPSWAAMLFFPSLVLCLALALSYWTRRRALAAPPEARASVWFWCFRFLRYLNLGTVALWWFLTDLVHLKSYTAVLWEDYRLDQLPAGNAIFLLLFWIPPIAVLIACQLLFQPVYARVRGINWSHADLLRQAVYGLGVWLVPALCFVGAFNGIAGDAGFGTFVCCCMLGILSLIFSARGLRKQFFLFPYALTTGELRDRAFSLASKLGVKLRQIYLLPPGKTRLANAFARSGNSILLTEMLLTHLNKREVDGVIAHELSHLKHDHPRLLGFALMGGFAVVAVPFYATLWSPEIQPYFDLLFVSIPLLIFYFISRRFEYTADATAAKLTGDPAASITGLVKLHHLNLMPLEWSKWSEKGLTHPSTLRRAYAIGRTSAMSDQRVAELLTTPAQEASSGEPNDFYASPAPGKTAGKIFSTEFKQRAALRAFWCYFLLATVLPALLLSGFDRLAWPGSGFLAFLLAAVLSGGLALLLSNFLPFASNATLCRKLRASSVSPGIPTSSSEALLVGFSPGATPRIFESSYIWDVGSLLFTTDRLCYFGEETQFALRRDQIISLQSGEGFPGWFRTRFLYISCYVADNSTPFVFNLRPLQTSSVLQFKREVTALETRLNAWRSGSAIYPAPDVSDSLHDPRVGQVTSVSTAEAWQPRQATAIAVVIAALSGFFAYLLGLPIEGIAPIFRGGEDLPSSVYSGISGWCAILLSVIILLILYGPFWFARSPKPSLSPAVPPPPVPAGQSGKT